MRMKGKNAANPPPLFCIGWENTKIKYPLFSYDSSLPITYINLKL